MSGSESGDWLNVTLLCISILGLVVSCCTPFITALANIVTFAGFRVIRDRLSNKQESTVSNGISADSQLVCKFQRNDDV